MALSKLNASCDTRLQWNYESVIDIRPINKGLTGIRVGWVKRPSMKVI